MHSSRKKKEDTSKIRVSFSNNSYSNSENIYHIGLDARHLHAFQTVPLRYKYVCGDELGKIGT